MGQKSYLKVDGIRGSSSDLGHVGDLEINSFSYTYTGKSRSEQVKVTVQMELEGSFAFFYDKMMNNQKLKDATLTVEIRNQFNQLFQTYKAEMKGLKVRVQGAPIWSRTFAAVGMAPTVIAYNEVYNAIQNGVIAAGENEAAGVEQMKFFEVGPNLNMTQHAITIRPLCFSGKTFAKLPPDLQAAILKAGKEAGTYGRQIESSEDSAKLEALEKAGKLKRIPFTERAQMQALVDPVMAAYAKEIGAEAIHAKILAIK